MSTTYTTTAAAIKTKLETIKGVGKVLQNVYDYFEEQPDGFPVAMFEEEKRDNDYHATDENKSTFFYNVYVWTEMEKDGRSDAMTKLRAAADEVIRVFDNDQTLGGAVDFCRPVDETWGQFSTGKGEAKFVVFRLEIVKIIVLPIT